MKSSPTTQVDPRIERSRRAILDATLDELADVGYGALTVEGVARRAKVGKATIYRHWDGKLDLMADAITTLKQRVGPPADGDHRTRIVGMIRALAEHLANSRHAACLPAIIEASQRDLAVREFHLRSSQERKAVLVGLLHEAADAGHVRADADLELTAELLVGPLFIRLFLSPEPFPPADVDALVAVVLDPVWIT